MSRVDLHVHTTASDGRFTPAEIIRRAAALGLTVIAITDHDSVAGVAPAVAAAGAFPGLTVVPGVEINTDVPDGEAHILGYFIDDGNGELVGTLDRLRNSRVLRAQRMIARLRDLGINIDWQRVQEIAGSGSIGRPHIAQAMLQKGYIASLHEAFVRYIGRNCPAYVEREKITPEGAVEMVAGAGGLPVLAHPFTVPDPEALVVRLKGVGLVGLEIYYGGYGVEEMGTLEALAAKYRLIATGGTDYHGLEEGKDVEIGGTDVPESAARQLIALARQKGMLRET